MAPDACWKSSHHNYVPGKEEEEGKDKKSPCCSLSKDTSEQFDSKKFFFYIPLATQLL